MKASLFSAISHITLWPLPTAALKRARTPRKMADDRSEAGKVQGRLGHLMGSKLASFLKPLEDLSQSQTLKLG